MGYTSKDEYIGDYEYLKKQFNDIYLKFQYRNRKFLYRGYCVDTAGKNAVKNQLKQGEFGE